MRPTGSQRPTPPDRQWTRPGTARASPGLYRGRGTNGGALAAAAPGPPAEGSNTGAAWARGARGGAGPRQVGLLLFLIISISIDYTHYRMINYDCLLLFYNYSIIAKTQMIIRDYCIISQKTIISPIALRLFQLFFRHIFNCY